ncbi:MAG TPA: hypothetical protein VM369_04880, partial [Candidatus Binatia bacterium]|nr:hypothetical protein [Candidatus Binatia bacterium]
PRAACGAGDSPETALSGQVPLAERISLRSAAGYQCNLELVGQYVGEGAEIQHTSIDDCSYYNQSSLYNMLGEARPTRGVVVIDAADTRNPKPVGDTLNTPAMLSPWESLKANKARHLLAANHGLVPQGGPELDVYDVADCRHPRLLFSGVFDDGTHIGHEGEWAPAGDIYWGSSTSDYWAADMRNPAEPQFMTQFVPAEAGTHGLSVSADGKRTYFTQANAMGAQQGDANNGFLIADTSELQARKPGAEIRVIGSATWGDGGEAQHTIPVKIGGKPFLVHADEFGSGGIGGHEAWAWACANELPPWGMVRLFDISDETKPKLASKLMLDVNDPANCADTLPDNAERLVFGYDSHYCAVDDPENTKIVACAWFVSGLRVFDVSDPYHPKEFGYYIPPVKPGLNLGSGDNFSGLCESTDWILDQPRIRRDRNEIWFTSMCGGFQVVKFTKPLP